MSSLEMSSLEMSSLEMSSLEWKRNIMIDNCDYDIEKQNFWKNPDFRDNEISIYFKFEEYSSMIYIVFYFKSDNTKIKEKHVPHYLLQCTAASMIDDDLCMIMRSESYV